VKLSQWASRRGIPKRTAQRMFHRNEIDAPTKVTSTGRLLVLVDEAEFPESMTLEQATARIRQLEDQQRRIERKLDLVLDALNGR